ncbi:retrovirus-related pol polyprotein from transposon TNT 1-94 [Tanacetum coccineum]
MDSIRKNKTWELVDHPAGQNLVSCKWLFKIKEGIEGVQKPRYKARLVAYGFTQKACMDYNEVFSLTIMIACREQGGDWVPPPTTTLLTKGVSNEGLGKQRRFLGMKMSGSGVTRSEGLVYGADRGNHMDVTCFVDSDYAKDPDKELERSYLAKGLLEELGLSTVNVCYHFIRDILEAKTVKVLKVGTEHNVADALTKVVLESSYKTTWSC